MLGPEDLSGQGSDCGWLRRSGSPCTPTPQARHSRAEGCLAHKRAVCLFWELGLRGLVREA